MDINAAFTEKVHRGIFNPVARHLANPNTAEDRMQEGLALTWDQYRRRAEEGRVLDDALLVHIAKLKATDLGRSIVPAQGHPRRDAMDPRNFHCGRVELCVFDELGHAVLGSMNPEPKLQGAIDLESWLTGLTEKDQAIVTAKAEGWTLKEIAASVGMSFSGVRGRLQRLGQELAAWAGLPVPGAAAA